MICVNIINGKRKIGNSKLLWLEYAVSLIFPFLNASDNIIEFKFLHHKCYMAQNSLINSSKVQCFSHHKCYMQHKQIQVYCPCGTKQILLISSSNVCISYHAAQNKSWSWHQNIMTLPISYLNKSTYYIPIFHIKSV